MMKANERKQTNLLPYHIIERATEGDLLALEVVLKHYEQYIKKLSTRIACDDQGNRYYYVDQTLRGILQNKLIQKTLDFEII